VSIPSARWVREGRNWEVGFMRRAAVSWYESAEITTREVKLR